jgi:predicted AAA+ superfamily ATPase
MEKIYIPRNLTSAAKEILQYFPALIIQGARQTGKSTFAAKLTEHDPEAKVVSFDDEDTRAAFYQDRQFFMNQSDTTLVIDEIQRVPESILAVKSSIDNNRRPGRFILTGSSNLLELNSIPDSLAGRTATVQMQGFSQGELAGTKEDFFSCARALDYHFPSFTSFLGRNDYLDMLVQGQYPEPCRFPENIRKVWYSNYMKQLFLRDINDINTRISSERLKAAFQLLAANQSGEMVKGRYAKQLNISPQTFADYCAVLKTMYLVSELPNWSNNLTTRQVSRTKTIVNDSALALHAAKTTREQLAEFLRPTMLGAITEAFVISELQKQKTWSEQNFELYHYRDRLGNEVDCVVEFADGHIVLIETKASTSYSGQQFAGIKFLAEKLGPRFQAGFVLGMSNQAYPFARNMWGLPISALWELQEHAKADE